MARQPSPEIDDELFNEVYGKEYTGPMRSTSNNAEAKANASKRSLANDQSDEENELRDPNAVPTDFTSREAKVWEAKAKAIERNWKKRKEEEMICKLCGESGHFTQGCPSTLGANRKSADFFERVPARDKNVRALFSDKVISQIEKDVGCKIKMDEKFLFVSGKDRLVLSKGLDAVHKIIHEKDKGKSPSRSDIRSERARSRSPDRSPVGSHLRRSDSQKSRSSIGNSIHLHSKGYEDNLREDLQRMSRGSSQAYTNDGAKSHPAPTKSPVRPTTYGGNSFSSYDEQHRNIGLQKRSGWDVGKSEMDSLFEHKSGIPTYPQTLEELETEFKREINDLGRVRDQDEDEEIHKHRECIRDLNENYMKKMATIRGIQARHWEDFLQFSQKRQQQFSLQNAYGQPAHPDYDQSSRNLPYGASPSVSMDSRSRYGYPGENYQAPRPHEAYGEFQHQRRDDFGATHWRY
ncbi:hypothetical protein M5K25_001553 [Dendrobium thyrsiflorum]|uniref:CCHC-type domain-containing protein n=1 Tax=Dendrobium thyrsiflorum TaxID=117978 RepID=A0ABD0W2E6_DENTH